MPALSPFNCTLRERLCRHAARFAWNSNDFEHHVYHALPSIEVDSIASDSAETMVQRELFLLRLLLSNV